MDIQKENGSFKKKMRLLTYPKGKIFHLGTLAALLLLAYLSYNGTFSSVLNILGGSHIDRVNQAYLVSSDKSATELFEVLGAAKVALALLKSSQGGISFFIDIQVQLGQSLNVVYEMVDYAWVFSIAALTSIKSMELLLGLSHLSVSPLLTAMFCFIGLTLGLRAYLPRVSKALSEASRLILFIVLLVHFAIPLAIYGTAAAGHHFFTDHKVDVHKGLSSALSSIPKHNPKNGLHSQVEDSINGFKTNQSVLRQNSSDVSELTIRHMTTVIIENLLMPLVLLYLMFLFIQRLLRQLLSKEKDEV